MSRFQITIAGESFPTKKALTDRCRAILWSYRPGDELTADHLAFMSELLRYHHEAEDKIGAGIESMFILPDQWGRQCFAVRRVDGTEIDFSFSSCINTKRPDADFRMACRSAIKGQILDAKAAAFAAGPVTCPITGQALTRSNCHVDHESPNTFKAILDDFIRENHIDPTSIGVVEVNLEAKLVNEDLALSWQEYHRSRARLRVVSVRANLSDLRKK